jgi:hypothetical protein
LPYHTFHETFDPTYNYFSEDKAYNPPIDFDTKLYYPDLLKETDRLYYQTLITARSSKTAHGHKATAVRCWPRAAFVTRSVYCAGMHFSKRQARKWCY